MRLCPPPPSIGRLDRVVAWAASGLGLDGSAPVLSHTGVWDAPLEEVRSQNST